MKNTKNTKLGIIIRNIIAFLVIGQEYSIIALMASDSKISIYSVVLKAVKMFKVSFCD